MTNDTEDASEAARAKKKQKKTCVVCETNEHYDVSCFKSLSCAAIGSSSCGTFSSGEYSLGIQQSGKHFHTNVRTAVTQACCWYAVFIRSRLLVTAIDIP